MIQDFGRTIISVGVVLVIFGGLLWLFGKLPLVGKLPGDILVKRDNFTFYAPIATGILISIILSILLIIFNLKK